MGSGRREESPSAGSTSAIGEPAWRKRAELRGSDWQACRFPLTTAIRWQVGHLQSRKTLWPLVEQCQQFFAIFDPGWGADGAESLSIPRDCDSGSPRDNSLAWRLSFPARRNRSIPEGRRSPQGAAQEPPGGRGGDRVHRQRSLAGSSGLPRDPRPRVHDRRRQTHVRSRDDRGDLLLGRSGPVCLAERRLSVRRKPRIQPRPRLRSRLRHPFSLRNVAARFDPRGGFTIRCGDGFRHAARAFAAVFFELLSDLRRSSWPQFAASRGIGDKV